jgi:hypothetical protein
MRSEEVMQMIGESEERGFEQAPKRASIRLEDAHEDPEEQSESASSELLSSFLAPERRQKSLRTVGSGDTWIRW